MRRAILAPVVLALLALVPASSALAEEAESTIETVWHDAHVRRGSWTFVTENDKYFAGTDRHYTNGLKILWLGETTLDESQAFIEGVANFIPTLHTDAKRQRYKLGLGLGQNIYTPSNTATPTLQLGDRPYAGWLYASMLAQAQENDGHLLRIVELSVGVVGPAALGRQAQNGWHDIINVPHAQGWDNQLKNEPGLMLSWERRYRLHTVKIDGRRVFDFIARGRLTVGNVHTHLAAGAKVRLGWNMPADFGADLIRPAGGAMANADDIRGFSTHLYLSAEARVVAQNIFLDGNTWRDSHSVRKRPVIGDFSGGWVITWPSFQLTYTQDMRTKEFYGQDKRDVFGSIALTFFR